MSEAPARPPRMVDQSGFTSALDFEHNYKEAYANIDKAITLVTENKHEEVSCNKYVDI